MNSVKQVKKFFMFLPKKVPVSLNSVQIALELILILFIYIRRVIWKILNLKLKN